MKITRAIIAAVAALAAVGCGDECPTETPKLDHVGSCTAQPGATVSYPVQTCETLGTACDVDMSGVGNGSGTIFLDPRIQVCDGGGPSCPATCSPTQTTCSFTAPAQGSYSVSAFDPCTNQTKTGLLTVDALQTPDCTL